MNVRRKWYMIYCAQFIFWLVLCGCMNNIREQNLTHMKDVAGIYQRSELSSVYSMHVYENGSFELYEVDFTANTQRTISGTWKSDGAYLTLYSNNTDDRHSWMFLHYKQDGENWLIPKDRIGNSIDPQALHEFSYKKTEEVDH